MSGDELSALLGLSDAEGERAEPSGPTPSDASATGGDELVSIAVTWIRPNREQPRRQFSEEELDGLAASIASVGVLQPVIVRRIDTDRYELIAGERRWRAAQRAGLAYVPALVRTADDQASLEQAVVENLHRQDLNPIEEAGAYQRLVDEFELTHGEVAARVGKSRSAVANTVRLLQLADAVQQLLMSGALGAGHARALLAVPDRARQSELAAQIVADGLSVREVEKLVRAGDARDRERRSPAPQERSAAVLEVEEILSDRLATKVTVSTTGGRGRLVVEFADLDDLARIFRQLEA